MFKIIKWFFYCFIFVLLWQIANIMDDNREQIGNMTLRLSDDLEKSAHDIIKQSQDNLKNVQQDLSDSVKQAGKKYISEMMK